MSPEPTEPSGDEPDSHLDPALVRVRLRQFRRWSIVFGAVLVTCLLYAWLWEPRQLVERDYTLHLANWPAQCDGLRIDQVTDLHTGSWMNGIDNVDRIVAKLSASDSDVVVFTGDYVILSVVLGKYVDPATIANHLAPLTEKKQVYAVLGNHDWWDGGPRVAREFERVGIHVLENESTRVGVRDCGFNLVGVDDLTAGKPQPLAAYARIDPGLPTIALEHEPEMFLKLPASTALVLAGHTHGGQVNPFGLRTPSTFRPRSAALTGEYHVGERTLFVSPGIGTSWLPLRMGRYPEISRLTLRSAQGSVAR